MTKTRVQQAPVAACETVDDQSGKRIPDWVLTTPPARVSEEALTTLEDADGVPANAP
jgi:hypothetical protein